MDKFISISLMLIFALLMNDYVDWPIEKSQSIQLRQLRSTSLDNNRWAKVYQNHSTSDSTQAKIAKTKNPFVAYSPPKKPRGRKPAGPKEPVSIPILNYKLTGAVIGKIAILRSPNGQTNSLKIGMELEGAKLIQIEKNSVTFSSKHGTHILEMQ